MTSDDKITSNEQQTTTPPSPSTTLPKTGIFEKAIVRFQRIKSMVKDSPLTVLGISLKQTPKIADIIEQSKILCEDYIYSHLSAIVADRDGSDGEETAVPMTGLLTDVSREIQLIGHRMEATYTTLFRNVSRQINIPLNSEMAVRKALTSIGDFMFKHSVVSWGRIVALFALSSAMSSECVQNGRPELIFAIITQFSEIIDKHVAAWISKQGGWVEIMKAFRIDKATRNLWALTGLGAMCGFFFTWITTAQI